MSRGMQGAWKRTRSRAVGINKGDEIVGHACMCDKSIATNGQPGEQSLSTSTTSSTFRCITNTVCVMGSKRYEGMDYPLSTIHTRREFR